MFLPANTLGTTSIKENLLVEKAKLVHDRGRQTEPRRGFPCPRFLSGAANRSRYSYPSTGACLIRQRRLVQGLTAKHRCRAACQLPTERVDDRQRGLG